MMNLDGKLSQQQATLDSQNPVNPEFVIRVAAEVHQRIAFIHPFTDGNGRVARLAMNHILRRYGQGYAILPPISESFEHFRVLEEAHRGNLESLAIFLRSHIHRT
jgi:Fic family protein